MTPRDVLLKAADLIEERGWGQGFCRTSPCAVDAISTTGAKSDWPAGGRALEALRDHLQVPSIAGWNDQPGRTQAEVVTALREAAERAA